MEYVEQSFKTDWFVKYVLLMLGITFGTYYYLMEFTRAPKWVAILVSATVLILSILVFVVLI